MDGRVCKIAVKHARLLLIRENFRMTFFAVRHNAVHTHMTLWRGIKEFYLNKMKFYETKIARGRFF
jgi:hypothetical protein